MTTILVTGGAGFIGSAFIRAILRDTPHSIVNVDQLTYAGNLESLAEIEHDPRYTFHRVDVRDGPALENVFARHSPDAVVHLAAESHVDRSIDGPADFITTNIVGTFSLLETSLHYWQAAPADVQQAFRLIHVSTDEVFGSLGSQGLFTESTAYDPSSPYSASKAASDHLVRAWHRTYGLPAIITNCSNNYGPFQFPEKLIPLMIERALAELPLPVYGRGENVRDWLYVEDHCRALRLVLERGTPGQTYNIGGGSEQRNIDVVHQVCDLLDELTSMDAIGPRRRLVNFVRDRPGHDLRYAIDSSKLRTELGWAPLESFSSGLRKTVEWYLANRAWTSRVLSGEYQGERLGLGGGQ